MPLRIAKLVRVSTAHLEQADSPQHQLSYIEGEAQRAGWGDSGLVYRAELTGAIIVDRPDIQRMLRDAEAGLFDAVVLKSVSRLGRDTLGLLMVKRMLDDCRVELIALADGYRSFRDPELIFLVHAERAQAGRQEIAKNVRAGIEQAARRGIWPAGTLPFGLRKEGRFAVGPDPDTAPIVQLIFALRRQGLGLGAIARHLSEEVRVRPPAWWHLREQIGRLEASGEAARDDRVRARLESLRGRVGSGCFRWQPRTVRLILENTAYVGELRYNRTEGERRLHGRLVRRPRSPDRWVTIPCTPLLSREEWEAARAVGRLRARLPRRSLGSSFLLSGLAFCGVCGSPMRALSARPGAGRRGGDPKGYYLCRASAETGAHPGRYIPAAGLEEAVLARLREDLAGLVPPVLPGGRARARSGAGSRHAPPDPAAVEAALRDLAEARFYRREELRLGRITPDEFAAELAIIRQREEALRQPAPVRPPPHPPALEEPPAGRPGELMALRGPAEALKVLLQTLVHRATVYSRTQVELHVAYAREELPESKA